MFINTAGRNFTLRKSISSNPFEGLVKKSIISTLKRAKNEESSINIFGLIKQDSDSEGYSKAKELDDNNDSEEEKGT